MASASTAKDKDIARAERRLAKLSARRLAAMHGEIREGRVAEGLAAGIRDVGVVLAERFPRDAEDTNELPDRLIEV